VNVAIPIVFDVNVLVGAVAGGNSPFRTWPSPPRLTGNPCSECLGIMVDAVVFALWLSPRLLDNARRVLTEGFGWSVERVDQYIDVLSRIASHSGGDVVIPAATVADCADWDHNRLLDLATEVGALLIVANDPDLTSMSPWRGTPILDPREFTAKVDIMRRHRRPRTI
jgi:predicted nucleic acid-binding protein